MGYQLWSQSNFTKGELSPFMYSRADVEPYYNGVRLAQNTLTYPTGAIGKRFGTLYNATLAGITAFDQFYFDTFQYLDVCTFQLVFSPLNIAIYLEGILVANVVTTLDAVSAYNLTATTITLNGATFRVTGEGFRPKDLTVALAPGVTIASQSANQFTLASPALTVGVVLPVQFTTSGTLPVTSPQIRPNITYFIRPTSTTTFSVHATAYNAKFNIDPFTITNIGTGTNNVRLLNVWSFANTYFKNLPTYDFVGGYDALTFTPSATTGDAVTITVSSAFAPLTSVYVGGAFFGGGGSGRITAVASTTSFTVAVQTPFDSTSAIQGRLALLAEPAWSDIRGWPTICSSYQNRSIFANSASLPNGIWLSVINDYTDYGDLTTDDDDAISWYPTSNAINVIRFIVPFRSITVHTNSGIYSSPLSEISAITPTTFTLQLQDSTPADVLQPQAIDNQIIVLSGNDAHTMLWDGINNAYTSNIVSIANEQQIRNPLDETAYADLNRAGSRYIFIINGNGSMTVYQTLQAEGVSGFTPQIMEQSYGSALFRQVASNSEGRAWFVVERQIAQAATPVAISGFTSNTLTATGSNLSTTSPTAVTFTTSGSLPTSSPQIAVSTYYWAMGIDANTIAVFRTQEDALLNVNRITFTNAGTSSNVVPWPLGTIFTLEELTQDHKLDCAVYYDGTPASVVTTGALFNAQAIKMVGDGFGFDAVGINNQVTFKAHGQPVEVSEAYIGFPINTVIEPLPIAPPPGQQTNLTKPTHIRTVRFMFNNTIGGRINGVPIALNPLLETGIGEPPVPSRGVFEISIMRGWDDMKLPTFTISHNEPFDIQLLGVFYSLDT